MTTLVQNPLTNKQSIAGQSQDYSIRDAIHRTLTNYFSQLGEQQPANLYDMVLTEVEFPLLDAVMSYTKNNQSRAAIIMGLSRGTLRKLLKKYQFID